jgi:DNA-binding phage protein
MFCINCVLTLQDISITSDKTRQLLKRVTQRGDVAYTMLKEYLKETNQSHLVQLLEMTERRENTTEIRKEISRTSIPATLSPHRMASEGMVKLLRTLIQ